MFNWLKKSKSEFFILALLSSTFVFVFCSNTTTNENKFSVNEILETKDSIINTLGTSIASRFLTPKHAIREKVEENNWSWYLRNLPLKKDGTPVKYFDGNSKTSTDIYCAVVDMSLGNRDLQQCADAVMRLRGEFLYDQKAFDKIHFNFLSDGRPRYYLDHSKGKTDHESFLKYMNYIFAFANTGSLHDELQAVEKFESMEIGDVFIQKGSPYGHAVIVVDMCKDTVSNTPYFLLAQSYMPAQDTQILLNPRQSEISPWYALKEGNIITPEWNFKSTDLRRFKAN